MALRFALVAALAAGAPLAAAAQESGAQSSALNRLDAWSVSALARADGALAPDLWATSDATIVAELMDRLPATYASPAVRDLARRVLLSGGAAPSGDSASAARARFGALERMGLADELASLAAGASDAALMGQAARAELARNARNVACVRARGGENAQIDAFAQRLRAYCAAAAGERAAADLALELAAGAGARDPWYTAAIAAVGGAPGARPPAARFNDALATAISLSARLPVASDALTRAPSLSLVAVARNADASALLRAQAAALAYARGALSVREARGILALAPAEAGAPAIATAVKQIDSAPGSLAAAGAIAGVLRASASLAEFKAVSQLFVRDIAALSAAPDPASTLIFARAAIYAGDAGLAQRITDSARVAGADSNALARLDAAISALEGAATPALSARINAAGNLVARDSVILTALGARADGAAQSFMLTHPPRGGTSADPTLLVQLEAAITRGARGEAALFAALAAGDAPSRMEASDLAGLIAALRRIGLEADARALAIEALTTGAPA